MEEKKSKEKVRQYKLSLKIVLDEDLKYLKMDVPKKIILRKKKTKNLKICTMSCKTKRREFS